MRKLLESIESSNRCVGILLRIVFKMHQRVNNRTNTGKRYPLVNPSGPGAYPSRILAAKLPGNYFSFREKKGMISFTPNGKSVVYNDAGEWALDGRQSISAGRWLGKMFSPRAVKRLKLEGDPVAQFATAIKAEESRFLTKIEMVSIEEAYDRDNWYSELDVYVDGKLSEYDPRCPGSCMWDKPVADFYKLFGVEQCVVLRDSNSKMVARAILWPKVQFHRLEKTLPFMDRCYWVEEEHRKLIYDYACKNGWVCKLRDAQGTQYPFLMPNGDNWFDRVTVHQTIGTDSSIEELDFHPYLDTIRHQAVGYLTNQDWTKDSNVQWHFEVTKGKREYVHENHVQDHRGNWIEPQRAVTINGVVYDYHGGEVVCEEDEGRWQLAADCVHVIDYGWYLKDSESICLHVDGHWRLKRNSVEVDGEWYRSNDHRLIYRYDLGRWVKKNSLALPVQPIPAIEEAAALLKQCPVLPLQKRISMLAWGFARNFHGLSVRDIVYESKRAKKPLDVWVEWYYERYCPEDTRPYVKPMEV